MSEKDRLRSEMRRRLAKITDAERCESSARIVAELRNLMRDGNTIGVFAGLPTEPCLANLHESDLTIAYPLTTSAAEMTFHRVDRVKDLQLRSYGILEPVEGRHPPIHPKAFDFIICPGLAFTVDGRRLGQGAGFYDRFLVRAPQAALIGVGFQCQLVSDLPTEPHDRLMHRVICT